LSIESHSQANQRTERKRRFDPLSFIIGPSFPKH
jgi:hypothetical protein